MIQGTVREAQERHSKARVAARSKSDFFFDWKGATIKAPDSAHVFSKPPESCGIKEVWFAAEILDSERTIQ